MGAEAPGDDEPRGDEGVPLARYDLDADGYLSEPEFDAAAGEAGLFGTYDTDADGRLTAAEFEAYARTLETDMAER